MNLLLEPMDERQLVIRLRKGEERAYQQVMDQWHQRIFNFALRYSNDRYFAAEVVQRTFIQVYEKIDQLKDASKFRPWLYRIASNCCASEGRRRRRSSFADLNQAAYREPDQSNPARDFEKVEMRQTVKEVLQMIPAEQRKVIIMKEYEGLKFREIAEITGESENTIKSRMYYGLDAMRKILNQKKIDKAVLS